MDLVASTPTRQRLPRALTARRNRKLRGPLRARIPSPRAMGRGLLRGLRPLLPIFVAVSASAAIAAGTYFGYRWVTTSDRFAVDEIEFRGNQVLAVDSIRDRLGIDADDNIFQLDLSGLEDRLIADPWIADAEVRRELPDRLIVTIVENRPAVLVDLGGLYLADDRGHIFKRAAIDRGEGAGLPVITGIPRARFVDDQPGVEAEIRHALAATAVYATGTRPRLGEIHVDERRGITFMTYADALAIRVGNGSSQTLSRRLHTFDIAWASLEPETRAAAHVVYVDNTTRPDRVTVGFGDPGAN
jgi:cell division protein FtsQ